MPFGPIAGSPPLFAVLPLLPATASLFIILAFSLLGLIGAAIRLRPGAMKFLARVVWRQKPGLFVLAVIVALVVLLSGRLGTAKTSHGLRDESVSARWPVFRGTLARTGHGDQGAGPVSGLVQWTGGRGFQFLSSPTIAGDNLIAIGSQGDSARLFCWDAESGDLRWSIAPRGYRATLSSAVIDGGYLVCGEGLHQTTNSRVMCFQLRNGREPELVSQFATMSHVECTPVLADGRIYFGAGDDGIYCLEPISGNDPSLRVVWHVPGSKYPDAETALAIHEGRVYAGLGFGGEAVCVLDAHTGREIARLPMPFPVFSPPAIERGKLYVGMGRANYVSQEQGGPGEVRCIDLASLQTVWKFETPAAVLAAIVVRDHDVIFSTVAGHVFVVDDHGHVKRQWHARAKMLTAPAVTDQAIYCVSCDGMLTSVDRQLERVWSAPLGAPGNYVSSPVVVRGRVFVGTPADGFLCVGEPPHQDMNSIWAGALGGPGRAGSATNSPIGPDVEVAWTLAGPSDDITADVSAPPAVAKRDLVVPMVAEKWAGLVCADLSSDEPPRPRWNWESPDVIEVSPVLSRTTVYCLSGKRGHTGQLVALDRRTGLVLWRHPVLSVNNSLSSDGDSAYVVDGPGWLTRFGPHGHRQWRINLSSPEFPIHIHDEIIAGVTTAPNRLFTLDRDSGRVLWQVDLTHAPADSPVIIESRLFVVTSEGMEFRSLVNGSLLTSMLGWNPSAATFINRDQFICTTHQGELLIGSPLARSLQRRSLGLKPGIPPLVGSNAIVYAVDDQRLMRISLDGSQEPEPWFSSDIGRFTKPLVLADGRIYVSVTERGLFCLKSSPKP